MSSTGSGPTTTPSRLSLALSTRSGPLRDVGLLLGRVVLGVVFVAHGAKKFQDGIAGTQGAFDAMGVPLPEVSAVAVASIEIAGGALLVLGALTPVVGVLLAAIMVGAGWFAHRDAFFGSEGGFEFVLVLAAFSALLALVGPGRLSLDERIAARAAA